MRLSNFGIEWNRYFSTLKIFEFGYFNSREISTSSEHLLFGNTRRFCIKVCFFNGGFLVVAVVVSLWDQARNMASFVNL